MEWYDYLDPDNELENKCTECGTPIKEDKTYCSRDCYNGSML